MSCINQLLELGLDPIYVTTTSAEGLCWTRTAERQTSRMRMKYLNSVLKQEVSFFDTQTAGSSTTFQVISIISSDANAVQVALCEKVRFQSQYN